MSSVRDGYKVSADSLCKWLQYLLKLWIHFCQSGQQPFPVLLKIKSEHLVIPHELSLIDLAISQHSSPGSLKVVIGVENVPGGVDSVPGRNLMITMCHDILLTSDT